METLSSVLLIHGGTLGDFVLTLSIIRALKSAGANRITVLARGPHAFLARRGGAEAFWDIDVSPWHHLFSPALAAPAPVRQQLFGLDLAIDFLGGSALVRGLSAAGIKRVIRVDPRPRPEYHGHIVEQWMADLVDAALDLGPIPSPHVEISETEASRARADLLQLLGVESDTMVLIHPGSGSNAKCWPVDRFIGLARRMQTRQFGVVFLIGPAEIDRWPPTVLRQLTEVGPVINDPSIDRLSQFLAAADLYIGNDSGVSHLAAAVGTPTLTIFGPTCPVRWSPRGPRVAVVGPETDDPWPILDQVTDGVLSIAPIRKTRTKGARSS